MVMRVPPEWERTQPYIEAGLDMGAQNAGIPGYEGFHYYPPSYKPDSVDGGEPGIGSPREAVDNVGMVRVDSGAAARSWGQSIFDDVDPVFFADSADGYIDPVISGVPGASHVPIEGWFRYDSEPMADFREAREYDLSLMSEAYSGPVGDREYGMAWFDDYHARFFDDNSWKIPAGLYHIDDLEALDGRWPGYFQEQEALDNLRAINQKKADLAAADPSVVAIDFHPVCTHCYDAYRKAGDPSGGATMRFQHGLRGTYWADGCFLCGQSEDVFGVMQTSMDHVEAIKKQHHDLYLDAGFGLRRVMYENKITRKDITKSFLKFMFSRPYREMFVAHRNSLKKKELRSQWPFNRLEDKAARFADEKLHDSLGDVPMGGAAFFEGAGSTFGRSRYPPSPVSSQPTRMPSRRTGAVGFAQDEETRWD